MIDPIRGRAVIFLVRCGFTPCLFKEICFVCPADSIDGISSFIIYWVSFLKWINVTNFDSLKPETVQSPSFLQVFNNHAHCVQSSKSPRRTVQKGTLKKIIRVENWTYWTVTRGWHQSRCRGNNKWNSRWDSVKFGTLTGQQTWDATRWTARCQPSQVATSSRSSQPDPHPDPDLDPWSR